MDSKMEEARRRHQAVDLPPELPFAVHAALRQGERQRARVRALRRSLTGTLAACACFVLLVNASPAFANALADVPVLGSLARVCTIRQFSEHDETKLLDVRLPALEHTGSTDLEQRINTEITTRVEETLAEARVRAALDRQAFLDTGGRAEEFIPVIITVDYEIKCQNDRYLSFILTKTETQANAYTQFYTYNIDLEAGRTLSLRDLLGPDWRTLCDETVRAEIARRTAEDPSCMYFEGTEGFQTVADNQSFYLSPAGNPVLLFAKYEIAPGSMGIQEFEVPLSAPQ